MSIEVRACLHCKGKGTTFHAGFQALANDDGSPGTIYPDRTQKCYKCNGDKEYPAPDFQTLLEMITTARGMKNGERKILSSFPSKLKRYEDRKANRAYFIWRMARFHGGKDMTQPFTASLLIGGDPFYEELEVMADNVAKAYFGSDMEAAKQWARAFGIL